MTNADATGSPGEQIQDPDSTGQESWLERLRAAVGLKPSASIRQDLAEAIAGSDNAAGFSPEERAMLANILRLRDVRVDDVMVPRADIDSIDISATLAELLAAFEQSGHSRMPVYRETLDDPVGFVHIKDLMSHVTAAAQVPGGGIDLARVDLARPLKDAGLVRNILFVPPSMPVMALLAGMQASRMQLALVIDEYGGTDGLVSLEDVVEMVVGDIEDEHDDDDGPAIVADGDGFLADARADLDEVTAAVGTDIVPADKGEDVDTVGGLVVSLLGRVPVRGELVPLPGGFEAEVLDADPRRIKRLRIQRQPAKPEPRRRAPRPAAAEAEAAAPAAAQPPVPTRAESAG